MRRALSALTLALGAQACASVPARAPAAPAPELVLWTDFRAVREDSEPPGCQGHIAGELEGALMTAGFRVVHASTDADVALVAEGSCGFGKSPFWTDARLRAEADGAVIETYAAELDVHGEVVVNLAEQVRGSAKLMELAKKKLGKK